MSTELAPPRTHILRRLSINTLASSYFFLSERVAELVNIERHVVTKLCRLSVPAMKRNASPELSGRPSPYHSAVTLYGSVADEGPRRSKRVKIREEMISHVPKTEVDEELPVPSGSKRRTVKAASLKVEFEDIAEAKAPSRTKSSSSRKTKAIPQSLAVPHPAPARWKEAYETIKRMRENIVAPVDTMGCEQAQLKEIDPVNRRFSTLVSLMLSSQTKDEVTDAAVSKLREAVGGTLSVQAVLAADDSTISEAIAKVGFWRRKTQYIKQTAQKLQDEFDSDVPKTVDELCSLPGVGPKMAFLCLHVAWNINVGIGVDVHVHRITNRLGWHKPPTKTPEETRLNLQSWLPTEFHHEINHRLVGFGQMICLPVGPRCNSCDLSNGLCPTGSASKLTKTKLKSSKLNARAVAGFSSLDSGGPKVEIEVEGDSKIKVEQEP
ncbi:DNA glycosylase [Trametopsis cervina]|nr:DNA glycosylase [Trametopsis cervina]